MKSPCGNPDHFGHGRGAPLEVEESLVVREENLERVLDLVWPVAGYIETDQLHLRLKEVKHKIGMHLYGIRQSENRRERVKLRLKKGELQARAQVKCIGLLGKTIATQTNWSAGPVVEELLRGLGTLSAAFVKDRYELIYASHGNAILMIGIDRLSILHRDTLQPTGDRLIYLELEGEDWLPPLRPAPVSERFWNKLQKFARPTRKGESKWETCSAAAGGAESPIADPAVFTGLAARALGAAPEGCIPVGDDETMEAAVSSIHSATARVAARSAQMP